MMDANSVLQSSCNESKDQPSVINSLIAERTNLTEQLKVASEKQKRYRFKRYALGINVLVKRIQFEQKKKWQAILNNYVAETIKLGNANQRALQELRDKQIRDRVEKCEDFSTLLIRETKYKEAQVEYSAENLERCTQEFRQASEVLDKKLTEREQQLHEDEKGYLEYLNTILDREEARLNTILQFVRSSTKELHRNIQSADNQLQAIQNKMKTWKEALAAYKAKE